MKLSVDDLLLIPYKGWVDGIVLGRRLQNLGTRPYPGMKNQRAHCHVSLAKHCWDDSMRQYSHKIFFCDIGKSGMTEPGKQDCRICACQSNPMNLCSDLWYDDAKHLILSLCYLELFVGSSCCPFLISGWRIVLYNSLFVPDCIDQFWLACVTFMLQIFHEEFFSASRAHIFILKLFLICAAGNLCCSCTAVPSDIKNIPSTDTSLSLETVDRSAKYDVSQSIGAWIHPGSHNNEASYLLCCKRNVSSTVWNSIYASSSKDKRTRQ